MAHTYITLSRRMILLFFLGQLCLMLGNQLALDVVRNQLVASKLSREGSTTTCQRTERDGVIGKFLQWNLSTQLLITSLAVHTHNQGTTTLQVAHHITHEVGRYINLQVIDWF